MTITETHFACIELTTTICQSFRRVGGHPKCPSVTRQLIDNVKGCDNQSEHQHWYDTWVRPHYCIQFGCSSTRSEDIYIAK